MPALPLHQVGTFQCLYNLGVVAPILAGREPPADPVPDRVRRGDVAGEQDESALVVAGGI